MKILYVFIVIALIIGIATPYALADEDMLRSLFKYGIIGAGTGAISAGASGGKAGEGALYGAGVGALGGLIFDSLMQTSTPSERSDSSYVDGFNKGFESGYNAGFTKGYEAGRSR